ncbi:zinc finger protein ZAT9-like [Curcuma longa]|uniref:zinc finger protein ZAT9-like n=1 Tax=Curcuma longa TaxID=136217 RepID=UPI003D9E4623
MEKHRCKQCYRRFASGRALAGHMRSHSVAAKASRRRFLPSPSVSSSSLPPAKGCAGGGESGRRMSAELSSSRESDAESSLNRRPKRFRGVDVGDEPHSSVSDGSAEEDVARWLVMLSRDAWSRRDAKGGPQSGGGDGGGEECEVGEDGGGSRSPSRRLMEFRCETSWAAACHSQKAHRGHKMGGMKQVPVPDGDEDFSGSGAAAHGQEAKLWECPYCNRVFRSGQALGGHKRSHLYSSTAIATTASLETHLPSPHSAFPAATTAASNNNETRRTRIDLNLPAPLEGEAELSALSVAMDLASK